MLQMPVLLLSIEIEKVQYIHFLKAVGNISHLLKGNGCQGKKQKPSVHE